MTPTRGSFLLLCTILVILSTTTTTTLAQVPSFPDFDTGLPLSAVSVFVTKDDYVIISDGSSSATIYSCAQLSCTSVASYIGGTLATYESGTLVTTDETNIYYFACSSYSNCTQQTYIPISGSYLAALVLSNGTIFAGYPGYPNGPGSVVSYTYLNGELNKGTTVFPGPSSCLLGGCLFYGYTLAALDGEVVTSDPYFGEIFYPSRNFTATESLSFAQFGNNVALGFDSSSGLQLLFAGFPGIDSSAGQVFVYTCNISACGSAFNLTSPNPGTNQFFGYTLAANGNNLLVSEPKAGSSGNGVIYFFACTSTGCNLISSFYPSYSSPSSYGYNDISFGTSIGAQVDFNKNPSVFSLREDQVFSGSAYSPSSITSIPTVPHPRHDCLISNGFMNDGGFNISTSDGTEYCCRFQGIIQGGQCGSNKCSSGFVAQGISTYFQNDDGSHCFALCYTQGYGITTVPIFQGTQYKPSSPVSLSTTVQGGFDCLIDSGTVNDAGYLVTDPSNNQYCCRFQGTYAFGECTHQVCGTSQPWGSPTVFIDASNTCYGQCFQTPSIS